MASVDKDTSRRRTPWVVRWRDEGGKQRKRGFARKLDADRFRAEVEHTMATGTYIDAAAGRRTFRAYAEEWLQGQPLRPNTLARKRSELKNHIYPAIGDRPLAALRLSQMQAFATGMDLEPSTARTVWATARSIVRAAVRDRLIGHDPCVGVKLPELHIEEVGLLLVEQVEQLATAVPKRFQALVDAVAGSGLRQGEVFGLEVPHVDFLRKTIRVEQQLQPIAGGGLAIVKPKNRSSYRTVPVGQVVIEALAAHLHQFPATEVEVRDHLGRQPTVRPAKLVFTTDEGKPLHKKTFTKAVWWPARVAAGVPDAGMHDLRHFFASLLIRGGLSVKAVARLLGHANPNITLSTYAHLWPDDEDRSREAVDAVLRRVDVPTMRPRREA